MSSGPSSDSAAETAAAIESVERTSSSNAAAVDLAGHGTRALQVHVGDGHARSLGGEPPAGRGADARTAAGHEGCAVRESHGGAAYALGAATT